MYSVSKLQPHFEDLHIPEGPVQCINSTEINSRMTDSANCDNQDFVHEDDALKPHFVNQTSFNDLDKRFK